MVYFQNSDLQNWRITFLINKTSQTETFQTCWIHVNSSNYNVQLYDIN